MGWWPTYEGCAREDIEACIDSFHGLTCHRCVISQSAIWQPQRQEPCQPLVKVLERNVSPSVKSFFTNFLRSQVSPESWVPQSVRIVHLMGMDILDIVLSKCSEITELNSYLFLWGGFPQNCLFSL